MQIFFLITDCYQPIQHLIWEDIYFFYEENFFADRGLSKTKNKSSKILMRHDNQVVSI